MKENTADYLIKSFYLDSSLIRALVKKISKLFFQEYQHYLFEIVFQSILYIIYSSHINQMGISIK